MYKKTAASRARAAKRPVRQRAGAKTARLRAKAAKTAPISAPVPAPALALTEKQRRHLRGLAHPLKPLIRLGNAGLTEGVARETDHLLHDHELIKVKGSGGDREARDAIFADLAQRTRSALVQRIGNVAVLFRPRADLSRIVLPGA
jgi:RNA-binding protein